jgi:H+-translocating NAD(P) transhydrogenase subunit alpha
MRAGIPKETFAGERRVALVPAVAPLLVKAGLELVLESGAGVAAGFPDRQYAEKAVSILPTRDDVLAQADLILSVRSFAPSASPSLAGLSSRHTVVGLLEPLISPEGASRLAASGATSFSLELIPRITRAQSMDVLSSMAMIVGYKAVLLAATEAPRLLPMMTTAGGTLTPARAFVIGGGVAGLQAIATARRLGALVHGYDIRPAVKEQVESLGAKFVELPLEAGETQDAGGYAKAMDEEFYKKQRALLGKTVAQSDLVICTAAVPGKKAPVLVTAEMVDGMTPGSVIVDIAAEQGGNCALTRAGERVEHNGVVILGPVNLASTVPSHASFLWARNLASFLSLLVEKDKPSLKIDTADPIVAESLLTRGGEVVHARVREALGLAPVPQPAAMA